MGASSPAAVQRRRDWIRDHGEGFDLDQLARILGVTKATVRADTRAVFGLNHVPADTGQPEPAPYDWRSEPRVRSRNGLAGTDPIIRFWQNFLTQNSDRNYRNAWACVLDRAADPEEYRELVQAIIRQAQHVQTMISDPEYRDRMMRTFAGRDDL